MRGRSGTIVTVALAMLMLWLSPRTGRAQLFHRARGHHEPPPPTYTLGQVAAMVDELDRALFAAGMIDIKAPDVWGQNRMTRHRDEFERTMYKQLGNFQEILQAAQRRADIAAMSSATALSFSPAAPAAAGGSGLFSGLPRAAKRAGLPSTPVVLPPPVVNNNLSGLPAAVAKDLAASSITLPGSTAAAATAAAPPASAAASDPSSLLDSISKRLDAMEANTLNMPKDINQLATREGQPGVGLEPTIRLDQEARYLNHLHELRRVNAGDDLTDMAGYGLYLLRLPVSLMPGPASRKGKGAVVTMEARHDLTPDLLENTFRDVVVTDATYALTRAINDNVHATICEEFQKKHKPAMANSAPPTEYQPRVGTYIGSLGEMITMPSAIAPSSGPGPVMTGDLRIILGPFDWPGLPEKYPSRFPPPVPNHYIEKYEHRLKEGLYNYYDRLQVLIAAIEGAEKDTYWHDPSTITLLRGALLETHRYMRNNAATNPMFQQPEVEKLAEMLFRRDLKGLIAEREVFLKELVVIRNNGDPSHWESQVTSTDVLAFVLSLQFAAVDRQLKQDMRIVSERRDCACGEVEHLSFYDFDPSPEAKEAFNAYVACKWPLHVYSVDPAVEQQNVLDAFSRRSELQLALAVSVASGSMNANNATKFARRLEFDLESVGLNRTAVGFGAGETTFGWRFYPRVQSPPTESNPLRIANLLAWNGPGPNWDVKNRQIEPGPRECIALMVVPNFIPALRIATVANWFDLTGHAARQQFENQQMLELSHGLQVARSALAIVCDSHLYRPQDLVHLTRRIKQLEDQLPTQDYRVDLPDEGDLLGSEIFSSNSATLAPMLLAWYGEPVKEGEYSSVFLMGRGFSVSETQVVAGGVNILETHKRLISRNVMQIVIPKNARAIGVCCTPAEDEGAHKQDAAHAAKGPRCARAVMDVHLATPNGISNHLFVDVDRRPEPDLHKTLTTTATTTTTVAGNQTSTTTRLEVTPPGIALPPLTILPLGTPWPPNGTFSPAAVTGAPPGHVVPGLVPATPGRDEREPSLFPTPRVVVPEPPRKKTTEEEKKEAAPRKEGTGGTPKPAAPGSAALPMPVDPVALRDRSQNASGTPNPGIARRPPDAEVDRTTLFAPARAAVQGPYFASAARAPRATASAPPSRKAATRPARKSLFDRWMQKGP